MSGLLHKRNPVHKVQKMISRRGSRTDSEKGTANPNSGMSPRWQCDGQWEADETNNEGDTRETSEAGSDTQKSSPASDASDRERPIAPKAAALIGLDLLPAKQEHTEATRAAAAALRVTLRETDDLAARSASESMAAAVAAAICERALASVEQDEAAKEREAAIALAVADATAAMAAEKEAALAAARAAADAERLAAVAAAKEEARREQARIIAELTAELSEQREHVDRSTTPARSAQHAAITLLIAEASPGIEGRDGVRCEAPAEPPAAPPEDAHHPNVSLQASLRNSRALESASKMPASLWRAHMWRTLVRVLWCA